ncbi:MAG: pilus assembly protein [Bryobacterales bacterium]|nr:pilus assembly protein [Bryobacterales bacterium]
MSEVQCDSSPARRSRRRGQRGAETLAGALALMVLIPFLVVTVDASWGIFVKVTLQHACREGVRYAITNQTAAAEGGGNMGHLDSIRGVVLTHAGGILAGQESKVTVRFYNATSLAEDLGSNRNRGGNVVMVSVEDYHYQPLITFSSIKDWSEMEIKPNNPIVITVHAADRMESCPMGVCSPL